MKKVQALCLMSIFVISQNLFALEERFIDTGVGIIEDKQTGLMWTQDTSLIEDIPIPEAQKFADKYTLSGYNDWRAPSENEIVTLVRGLHEFSARELFRHINFTDRFCGDDRAITDDVYLQQGGDTGVQYILCQDGTIFSSTTSLLGLSDTLKIWLVRSGEHSDIRYTQQEMDEARNDSYAHGLADNTGTVHQNLEVHMPSLNYSTNSGTQNLWADFRFSHEENGTLYWFLKGHGVNQ